MTQTLELLDRILPAAPAVLIDVGGGPGADAAVWARKGYEVHLYDVVVLPVEQASLVPQGDPDAPVLARRTTKVTLSTLVGFKR